MSKVSKTDFNFSNDLSERTMQYKSLLVRNGHESDSLNELSLRELREAVDELIPLMFTEIVGTANGKTKKVTVKKAA